MQALTDLTYKTDCREIIETQRARGLDRFQLPEPWSGHIEQARVLFISSNPSIGEGSIDDGRDYPRRWWADNDISRYFDERFGTTIFETAYLTLATVFKPPSIRQPRGPQSVHPAAARDDRGPRAVAWCPRFLFGDTRVL